mmetsp:Transcript_11800/g.24947  ORF Transcript_11800/g.24947 Transcript_11800/m.24947 type:complete len:346 (+) Transcript_11800:440-1477(+)
MLKIEQFQVLPNPLVAAIVVTAIVVAIAVSVVSTTVFVLFQGVFVLVLLRLQLQLVQIRERVPKNGRHARYLLQLASRNVHARKDVDGPAVGPHLLHQVHVVSARRNGRAPEELVCDQQAIDGQLVGRRFDVVVPVVGRVGVGVHGAHEFLQHCHFLGDLGGFDGACGGGIAKDLLQCMFVSAGGPHQHELLSKHGVHEGSVVPLVALFLEIGIEVVLDVPRASDEDCLDFGGIVVVVVSGVVVTVSVTTTTSATLPQCFRDVPQQRLVHRLEEFVDGLFVVAGTGSFLGNVGLYPGLGDGQRSGHETDVRQPRVHHHRCQFGLPVGVAGLLDQIQIDLVPALLF